MALAISSGFSALAMAEFIKTPSQPSSIALAASLAQPIPASTKTGTLAWSLISLILISVAVWQLTKIFELSKPVQSESTGVANDNENDIKFSINKVDHKISNFNTNNLESLILDLDCNASNIYTFTFEIDNPISLFGDGTSVDFLKGVLEDSVEESLKNNELRYGKTLERFSYLCWALILSRGFI